MENEQRGRQFDEVEAKLIAAQTVIEDKNLKIKDADQKMNQMKLEADSERALIEGLKGEKKHLEMNLEENIQLKEQFQKKCDQVQEMYEKLFKEAQEYKRDVVSVDEIKKDRD